MELSTNFILSDFFDGSNYDKKNISKDWNRFYEEAKYALNKVDYNLLKDWASESLSIALNATWGRALNLWDLVKAVAEGTWEEFKKLWNALWEGEITKYARDLCKRTWSFLKDIWSVLKNKTKDIKSFVSSIKDLSKAELIAVAASLVGAIIAFTVVGGTNGGVIDSDIKVLGLGGHRSIYFHSIVVGLAGEITFLSFFKLVELLHGNLPKKHLPIWDRMLKIYSRFTQGLITGTWIGVTTHLVFDAHIDGWTPYKDLPVSLPKWGHVMIMDLNAATSGWFAWQWLDKIKRHLRKNNFNPPRSKKGNIYSALPELKN
jgi:hypothetical protein